MPLSGDHVVGDPNFVPWANLVDSTIGSIQASVTAETTRATAAEATRQPLDADLTAIAALDSATAGALATDGSGWIRKTYAQLKTALGLVKADVGLGNVDNTADASKPVSTAQAAADTAVQAAAVQRANHTGTQLASTVSDFSTAALAATAGAYPSKASGASETIAAAWDFTTTPTLNGSPFGTGSGGSPSLSPTAVKTADYTAAAGDLVPVDTTSGSITITLPTAPADKTVVAVKHVTQGLTGSVANSVTVARGGTAVFNKTGGSTALTLPLVNQALWLQYKASSGIWYVLADDLALTQLDLRYLKTNTDGSGSTNGPGHVDFSGTRTLPWLEIANTSDQSSLHIVGGVGFTGPYLIGVNAAPATNVSQVTSNVDAAGNTAYVAHLYSHDSAASAGFYGITEAGSAGKMLWLTQGGGTGLIEHLYTSVTPSAGQQFVEWQSAAVAGGGHILRAYSDSTGLVEVLSNLQANGAPFVVSAVDANHTGNTDRLRAVGGAMAYHKYAGSSGLFYTGKITQSDTTAAGLILSVSTAAQAIGSETWLEAMRVQRIDGTHAGFSFFGGAAASKWTSLPADATDLASAIALVNDIKNNVIKRHSMAA